MKRILLLAACSVLLLNNANAQVPVVSKVLPKVTLGVKAGANFQTLSGSNWESSYKPGILGGAFVGVIFKDKFGVQAEGLVKSARFNVGGFSDNYVKTVSLDVPLLFQYKLFWRVWAHAGPQFSNIISAKDSANSDVKTFFKSSDISGVLGLEVKLPLHLTVGARYILGFSDVNNTAVSEAWRNRYAQLYLGFRFL